jgi:hypothetical protein
LTKEEKKNIETFIERCKKYDESVEIKGVTVGEESRILDTVCKTLNLIEKLQEENEQLKNEVMEKSLEIIGKEEYIKASIKDIFDVKMHNFNYLSETD